MPPAFVDVEVPAAPVAPPVKVAKPVAKPAPKPEPIDYEAFSEPEEALSPEAEGDSGPSKKKGKKGKQKRRELVFDEDRGEVVARRKRKGGRGRGWEDYEG